MLKKTMTYVDFDGNTRSEDFYFNLTQAEISKMQLSVNGGLDKFLEKIISEQDQTKIYSYIEEFVQTCYGEKSNDGKYFIKNDEALQRFISTQAYSDLMVELSTNAKATADFVNCVIPQKYVDALKDAWKDSNSAETPNA